MTKKILLVIGLTAMTLSAAACNTVRGVGQDLQSVANDVDDAWTLVGGSRALVDALMADPELEALELPEGAVLDGPEPEVR